MFVSFLIFNEHLQRGFLSVIQFNDLFLSTEVYLKRIMGKLYQNSKLNLSSSSSVEWLINLQRAEKYNMPSLSESIYLIIPSIQIAVIGESKNKIKLITRLRNL